MEQHEIAREEHREEGGLVRLGNALEGIHRLARERDRDRRALPSRTGRVADDRSEARESGAAPRARGGSTRAPRPRHRLPPLRVGGSRSRSRGRSAQAAGSAVRRGTHRRARRALPGARRSTLRRRSRGAPRARARARATRGARASRARAALPRVGTASMRGGAGRVRADRRGRRAEDDSRSISSHGSTTRS